MEANKNEKILWGVILVIIVLFIIFMPQIEGLLAGRYHLGKKKSTTEEVQKVTYPESTSCTLSGTTDPDLKATVSKTVNFTYDANGTVETIVLTTTTKFDDKSGYTKNKNAKAKQRAGVSTQVSNDDANNTITKKEIMTIKNMTDLTEYPTGYTKLKAYLSQNQYVCNEKK